jgi:hypothetical protein
MERQSCRVHKLVADVCLIRDGEVMLVRYLNTSGYDGEPGWFLPDDLRGEHPMMRGQNPRIRPVWAMWSRG